MKVMNAGWGLCYNTFHMKHRSTNLLLLLGILIVIGVAMLLNNFSIAHAQVPNNILLPPGPDDTYTIEIKHDGIYQTTGVTDSRGYTTEIEYDETGNLMRKVMIPTVITAEMPIIYYCSGPAPYNQPEYIYSNSYLSLDQVPLNCPSEEKGIVPVYATVSTTATVSVTSEEKNNNETETIKEDVQKESDNEIVHTESLPENIDEDFEEDEISFEISSQTSTSLKVRDASVKKNFLIRIFEYFGFYFKNKKDM